jgi:tRNA threonylcarbamoyladenosine biosynthesis protein TsaB
VVIPVIDARRGEVFVAGFRGGAEILHPQAMTPEALAEKAAHSGAGTHRPWLAIGDGAVRFRELLVQAGVTVPEPPSPVHRVSAITVCRLGTRAEPAPRSAVVPDYLRLPDAEEALRARSEGR